MKTKETTRRTAIEDTVRNILGILEVDRDSETYRETPRRVATMGFV